MAIDFTDLNSSQLASRLALLEADPKDRVGYKSPPSSPPNYVSETTDLKCRHNAWRDSTVERDSRVARAVDGLGLTL